MKNPFEQAVEDYRLLRNRGYPETASLQLVGNRHRLNAVQRQTLFRGVVPEPVGAPRRLKLQQARALAGQPLGIDWFNVLITVESYLKGLAVFVADDGVVRDAAAVHASYRPGPVSARAEEEVLQAVAALAPARVDLYLDSPISFSGAIAGGMREEWARRLPLPCSVQVVPSADYSLKSYPGIVATSDSAIMDRAARLFDLPRHVLESRFAAALPPLP